MINLTQTQKLPNVLTTSEIKYYIFSLSFAGAAVFTPWLLHKFQLLGPQFLPMHFFVLIAGFLFGWRTGLFVGILSPLMSYSISHMPPLMILSETILELAVYGLAIGLLREKKIHILFALPLAMLAGRATRLLLVLGLGLNTNPMQYFQMSWPGIVLQIILIPLAIIFLQKYFFRENK